MSDDATTLIREHAQLLSNQANFRRYWEEVAYYVMPAQATFLVQPSEGLKRTERLFDSTPVMANERFAASIESMSTPRGQLWGELTPEDDDLAEDRECKAWLDKINKQLFAMRYRNGAGFGTSTHENYLSLGAFGNMILFVDDAVSHPELFRRIGRGTVYRAIPMQESVWTCDHTGRVNTLYREFKLETQQACRMFGKSCPPTIRAQLEAAPYAKHEFLHIVKPNPELKSSARDYRGMEYASYYVAKAATTVVEPGGYRCWPFGIGRYAVAPLENYGRGPGMASLPAIRTLSEEKKTVLRAGQKVVDPPVLLYEEGVLEAFNQRAGAANYAMLTADGQPLAQPFETKGNIPLGLELMNLEKGDINDAFLVSLFQFLSQRTDTMTAAEVYVRQAQVAMMLAPSMGRTQDEYLGSIVHRELQVGFDSGCFENCGPMPRQLAMRGGSYKVNYTSPLSRASRAQEAGAITQTIQQFGEAAQIDPDVMLRLDLDGAMQEVADINGMPAKFIRSDDEVEALKQQKQQDQATKQIAAAAPGLSAAELNLARAEQARGASSAAAGQPLPASPTQPSPGGP